MLPSHYSPIACMYHYLHMARGNFRDYLRGDTVWVKKYFYVLRPLLAVKWIEAGYGIVPMEFSELVEALIHDAQLKAAILELLARKMAGDELDRGPRNDTISAFIEGELARLDTVPDSAPIVMPPIEETNRFFRQMLGIAWSA
jgi:hypothetical protein